MRSTYVANIQVVTTRHPISFDLPYRSVEARFRASFIGEVKVTDYSKLNYQQLVHIANDDSIAASMSEHEYESLSSEIWKKFKAEKQIVAQSDLSDLYHDSQSASGIHPAQPSLSRSGD